MLFCPQYKITLAKLVLLCVQAISNPRVELCQDKAWQAVLPLVSRLKRYYDFSTALGKCLAQQNLSAVIIIELM
jgi:hypothetical protein